MTLPFYYLNYAGLLPKNCSICFFANSLSFFSIQSKNCFEKAQKHRQTVSKPA